VGGEVCERVEVMVCRKCKRHACVEDFLREHTRAEIRLVRCQKICEAPVAGVEVRGRMEWFEHMDRPKALVALAKLVRRREQGKKPKPLQKPLAKRRRRAWSGRPPR